MNARHPRRNEIGAVNDYQNEMNTSRDTAHAPSCGVYFILHEGIEVGRVVLEVSATGYERWRVEGDLTGCTFDTLEEAAAACIGRALALQTAAS